MLWGGIGQPSELDTLAKFSEIIFALLKNKVMKLKTHFSLVCVSFYESMLYFCFSPGVTEFSLIFLMLPWISVLFHFNFSHH